MKKIAMSIALLMSVSLAYAADRHVPADGYYASYADAVARGEAEGVVPDDSPVRAGRHSPQLFVLRDLRNRERELVALIEDIDRRLALASRDFSGSPRSAGLMQQVGSLEMQVATAQEELRRVQDEVARLIRAGNEEEIEEGSEFSGE